MAIYLSYLKNYQMLKEQLLDNLTYSYFIY